MKQIFRIWYSPYLLHCYRHRYGLAFTGRIRKDIAVAGTCQTKGKIFDLECSRKSRYLLAVLRVIYFMTLEETGTFKVVLEYF
jgi:hypothetical protein